MAETSHGSGLRDLADAVVVMAFGGWSDAANVATDTVNHLAQMYGAEIRFAIDPGDYYDFQVSRPRVEKSATGQRVISWPTTEVLIAPLQGRDLVLIRGPEPNFHWPDFVKEFASAIVSMDPHLVVVLGAMLGSVPHTRPIPVALSSDDPGLRGTYGAEPPTYEGRTGMQGIMAHALGALRLPVASLWATCPQYVPMGPNPKAVLALLTRLEEFYDAPLLLGDLEARAEEWESRISDAIEHSAPIADYIHHLEEASDESPEGFTGDAIAAEFQRYLRQQGNRWNDTDRNSLS